MGNSASLGWEEVSPACCYWIQSAFLKSTALIVMSGLRCFSHVSTKGPFPHIDQTSYIISVPLWIEGKWYCCLKLIIMSEVLDFLEQMLYMWQNPCLSWLEKVVDLCLCDSFLWVASRSSFLVFIHSTYQWIISKSLQLCSCFDLVYFPS